MSGGLTRGAGSRGGCSTIWDGDPDTWLIEGKLEEDVLDWEDVRLDFRSSEIEAEIVESSLPEPDRFTVRTRGQSPLQKGQTIHVDIREQSES